MQRTKKPEENKIKTRQQIRKVRSKRCCCRQSTWLIIAPMLHRYCSAVAPLSLRCRSVVNQLSHRYCTAIVPLSLRGRSAAVALLSRCCRTAIALVLLHCRSPAVAPDVATQSHRYCTAIAPLSLRCCCSCCCYVVAPLLYQYRSVVLPLLKRCRSSPEKV